MYHTLFAAGWRTLKPEPTVLGGREVGRIRETNGAAEQEGKTLLAALNNAVFAPQAISYNTVSIFVTHIHKLRFKTLNSEAETLSFDYAPLFEPNSFGTKNPTHHTRLPA